MTTQPQPNAEIVDRPLPTWASVAADAIANTFSGIGLGLLTGVGLWALGASWATVATWATASAIAWAGAINWIRFAQDELQNKLTFWRMARDIAELNAEVDALETENAALTDKIRWQEMRLKQPIRVNGRPLEPEADPAQKDATILINKRYGQGMPVTLRHMQSIGWSQERYTAALALLRDAGIVEVRGTQTQWAQHHSPAEALAILHVNTPVALQFNASVQAGEGL